MNEIMVGELSDFVEGGYRVLRVDSFEFGIFRQGDRLLAYENQCPHDGGPVCQGKVIPRVEEELAPDQTSRGLRFAKSRNIVCPWHGWEFDIETGRHCGDPKYRLRPVDVRVRDQRVYVSVPGENSFRKCKRPSLSSPRKRGPIVPHTAVSGIWVPACAGTTTS